MNDGTLESDQKEQGGAETEKDAHGQTVFFSRRDFLPAEADEKANRNPDSKRNEEINGRIKKCKGCRDPKGSETFEHPYGEKKCEKSGASAAVHT